MLGYGLDLEALERVAIPAIEYAKNESEVLVIDEIGKFTVESEKFVNCVRGALEIDKPTLLTLHKKVVTHFFKTSDEEMMVEYWKLRQ